MISKQYILCANGTDFSIQNEQLDGMLEEVYPALAAAQLPGNLDGVNKNDLAKLFRVTQLSMELKNIFLEEAEEELRGSEDQAYTIKELKAKVASLEAASKKSPSSMFSPTNMTPKRMPVLPMIL